MQADADSAAAKNKQPAAAPVSGSRSIVQTVASRNTNFSSSTLGSVCSASSLRGDRQMNYKWNQAATQSQASSLFSPGMLKNQVND
jgi:hypothetical protein